MQARRALMRSPFATLCCALALASPASAAAVCTLNVVNVSMDATHLTIWGDGSPGTSLLSRRGRRTGRLGGSFPIYGRVPALQNVPVGAYADTIIVTLTF